MPAALTIGDFSRNELISAHLAGLEQDLAYGTLAAYVASHALQVEGPIREHYLVGRQDTADENAWRTEICWPSRPSRHPLRDPFRGSRGVQHQGGH